MKSIFDDSVGHAKNVSLGLGIIGFCGCLIGWFVAPRDFFVAYLFGHFFFLGLSLGSLALLMIHHLTAGDWLADVDGSGLVLDHVPGSYLHRPGPERARACNFTACLGSALIRSWITCERGKFSQAWQLAARLHDDVGLPRVRTTACHLVGKSAA